MLVGKEDKIFQKNLFFLDSGQKVWQNRHRRYLSSQQAENRSQNL